MGGIFEGDEDGDDDEEDEYGRAGVVELDEVPQCFSHFTYSVTDGKRLVCDLQVRIRAMLLPPLLYCLLRDCFLSVNDDRGCGILQMALF